MDERTRACVRRMSLGDIGSLPECAFIRALEAFDRPLTRDRHFLGRLQSYRLMLIRKGMDPIKGRRHDGS